VALPVAARRRPAAHLAAQRLAVRLLGVRLLGAEHSVGSLLKATPTVRKRAWVRQGAALPRSQLTLPTKVHSCSWGAAHP